MSLWFWGYSFVFGFVLGVFFVYFGGVFFVVSGYFVLDLIEVGIYFGVLVIGYFFGNYVFGVYL